MNYSAIVLCAGRGTRYKGKKQDALFRGKPLWQHPYDTALEIVGENNIVAVGKDIEGGYYRSGSVLNGLHALPADTDRVIMLEAARPLVTKNQIERLLYDEHSSVSYVRPLVNTVIYRTGEYINRDEMYELLTPQAFDFKLLLEAYESGKFQDMTDDTRVMKEYHGIDPFFIETDDNLFKVTYPGDLDIIEVLYRKHNEV